MSFSKDYFFPAKIEMRWSDLDEFSIINNAKMMTYFEEARIKLLQAVEWDWQHEGIVVANANINYRTPLKLTDNPVVYTRCSAIGNKSFTLSCVIAEQLPEGAMKVFSEATFVLVGYDFKNKMSVKIPDDVKERLRQMFKLPQ